MKAKRLIAACVLAAGLLAGRAHAVELCAAIDGSGSVIFTEGAFGLQLEGLAAAVEDESIVPPTGDVSLAVVLFGSTAETVVPLTRVDSAGAAASLADAIRSITPREDFAFWHLTNMAAAVDACLALFEDPLEEWVIDISTDGRHNVASADPLSARDTAVLAGLDALNAIGVAAADGAFLENLVWPQPSASPPEDGFVILVADFTEYVDAMALKMRSEVSTALHVDIKPGSCPNSFNPADEGVLPVAIAGGTVDVSLIDPATVTLEGVSPLRWSYEDVVTTPGTPAVESSCRDCTTDGGDGITDLALKFSSREVAAAVGDVSAGDCRLLILTGRLQGGAGEELVSGDDTLRIVGRRGP